MASALSLTLLTRTQISSPQVPPSWLTFEIANKFYDAPRDAGGEGVGHSEAGGGIEADGGGEAEGGGEGGDEDDEEDVPLGALFGDGSNHTTTGTEGK